MATSNNNVGFAAQARQRRPNGLLGPESSPLNVLLSRAPTVPGHSVDNTPSDNPKWTPLRLEVRQSPNRGYGLFAVDSIPAYSRILEDPALLSMAAGEDIQQLWPKYQALPPEDKKTFDQLNAPAHQLEKEERMSSQLLQRDCRESDAKSMARVSSRFLGNSFKTTGEQWQYSLFPTVARINHSCTPNSHCHNRAVTGAQYVYALRDIHAGEEIEIAYFDMTLPLVERQKRTTAWSFKCRCPACSKQLRRDYEKDLADIHEGAGFGSDMANVTVRAKSHLARTQQAISFAESDDMPWLRVALPELYLRLVRALGASAKSAAISPAMSTIQWPDQEMADAEDESIKWKARILGADNLEVISAQAKAQDKRADRDAHPKP